LNNLNLDANFGQITAIMGPSGGGKTSLLRYLADLRSPNLIYSGEKNCAGHFKYVAQEDHLHGFMTVDSYLENYLGLNYGLKKESDREEINKLKQKILAEL
jgi:ABC-type multidrug transport system ATPase subunit